MYSTTKLALEMLVRYLPGKLLVVLIVFSTMCVIISLVIGIRSIFGPERVIG